jgi:hypothetical protein
MHSEPARFPPFCQELRNKGLLATDLHLCALVPHALDMPTLPWLVLWRARERPIRK